MSAIERGKKTIDEIIAKPKKLAELTKGDSISE
jgi:hypothetical protein